MSPTGPCKFRLDDNAPYRDGEIIQYFAVPHHFTVAAFALVADAEAGDDGHRPAHVVPLSRLRLPGGMDGVLHTARRDDHPSGLKLEKK